MKHFYIATSKIAGLGIMAGEDIKKGELIFRVKGPLKFKLNKSKRDALSHPNWWGIKPDHWIDPLKPYKFLNHSCNPNVGVKGKVAVHAIRDIKEGEELAIDYSTFEGDPRWEMPCSCDTAKCRKVIKGIQHLPKEVLDSYYPYISKGFPKLYKTSLK